MSGAGVEEKYGGHFDPDKDPQLGFEAEKDVFRTAGWKWVGGVNVILKPGESAYEPSGTEYTVAGTKIPWDEASDTGDARYPEDTFVISGDVVPPESMWRYREVFVVEDGHWKRVKSKTAD